MVTLGKFWAVICIILSILCFLKLIVNKFHYSFIRGLSKSRNRKLIDYSTRFMKSVNKNHGLFALGVLIALLLHANIMYKTRGFYFSGFLAALSLIYVIIVGFINKYVYRDKKGDFIKFHIIGTLVAILMILLHIMIM